MNNLCVFIFTLPKFVYQMSIGWSEIPQSHVHMCLVFLSSLISLLFVFCFLNVKNVLLLNLSYRSQYVMKPYLLHFGVCQVF